MGGGGKPQPILHEPPGDLFMMPANSVTALMTDGDGTAAAVVELAGEGLSEEEIFVLCGPAGLDLLDTGERHHHLRERLFDFRRMYGRTPTWLAERIHDHLESGGLAMVVHADEDAKPHVAEILGRNGGSEMAHFGRLHWEQLGSGTPNDSL